VVLWLWLRGQEPQLLIVKSDLAAADAIVVMSGSATYLERADWAARLYREGRAPIIILTNDSRSRMGSKEERNPYFYELAARELQKRGVPESKIQVVSDIALGTYEESLGVRRLRRRAPIEAAAGGNFCLSYAAHALVSAPRLRRQRIEIGIDSPPPGWQTPAPSRWCWHRWAGNRGGRVREIDLLLMRYWSVRQTSVCRLKVIRSALLHATIS